MTALTGIVILYVISSLIATTVFLLGYRSIAPLTLTDWIFAIFMGFSMPLSILALLMEIKDAKKGFEIIKNKKPRPQKKAEKEAKKRERKEEVARKSGVFYDAETDTYWNAPPEPLIDFTAYENTNGEKLFKPVNNINRGMVQFDAIKKSIKYCEASDFKKLNMVAVLKGELVNIMEVTCEKLNTFCDTPKYGIRIEYYTVLPEHKDTLIQVIEVVHEKITKLHEEVLAFEKEIKDEEARVMKAKINQHIEVIKGL